jgi:hypothetical protein
MNNNLKKGLICGLFAALSQSLFAQGTLYTFIVNIAGDGFPLPLIGVANIGRGAHSSAEIGVLNINAGSFAGIKTGVFNFTGGEFRGFSSGVLNITRGDTSGLQAGVINFANTMAGVQIGVINIVADGEKTLPVGLLPIVLRNGYYALELGVSALSPINASLKMGVKKLYTSLGISYNSSANVFHIGGGLGSIIDISELFFFNLEINSRSIINRKGYFLQSVEPAFGLNITPKLSLIAGPLIEYEYKKEGKDGGRFFRLAAFEITESSSLLLGAKAALRVRF